MSVPQMIGQYRVVEDRLLGAGGQGRVLLVAKGAPPIEQRFALKLIEPELTGDPEDAKRQTADARRLFLDEALVLSGLSHRNVVRAIEVGEHEGKCYLVMEYIDGVSLRGLLKTGRLPTNLALHIAIELCRGLSYCHDFARHKHLVELVHRDVKPDNILISIDGAVKLVDFGISKYQGRENQTITDVMRGTPQYMSPEHVDPSRTLDLRSDLFSLGVVLYEMLTGDNPLLIHDPRAPRAKSGTKAHHALATLLKQLPITPIETLAPYLDSELITLANQLLAYDKTQRPKSAHEVLEVLCRLPQRADATELLARYAQQARNETAGIDSKTPPSASAASGYASSAASGSAVGNTPPEGFALPDFMPRILTDEEADLLEESGAFLPPSLSTETASRSLHGTGSDLHRPRYEPSELELHRPQPSEPTADAFTHDHGAATAAPNPSSRRKPLHLAVGLGLTAALTAAFLMLHDATVRPPPSGESRKRPTETAPRARGAEDKRPRVPEPVAPIAAPQAPAPEPPLSPLAPLAEEATQATPAPESTSKDAATLATRTRVKPKLADVQVVVERWAYVWIGDKFLGVSPVTVSGLKPGPTIVGYGQNRDGPSFTRKVTLRPGPNNLAYAIE